MPRIQDSRADMHDFCLRCMPSGEGGRAEFGDLGDGPDGRGNCYNFDVEHPDYHGEGYRCEKCGKTLGKRDN